ncbi:MAG: hypothetical protein K9H58_01905 [Bacteroidales bacterium]|nr:hypothetical protein [Bacteroidales bacterium]
MKRISAYSFFLIRQQLLNMQIAKITTAALKINNTILWYPTVVTPAQQPKAPAIMRNKYPAKPIIPNKSAKFANTILMTFIL